MSNISRPQLISMLLITDSFLLFCLNGSISLMTICGFLTGTAIQMIIFLIAEKLTSFPHKTGRISGILLMIYLIFTGGFLFSRLWNASEVFALPNINRSFSGKLIMSLLVALVCLYITSAGIKSLSRSAVIISAVGILCITIAMASAVMKYKTGGIADAEDKNGFLKEIIRGITVSGGLGSFAVYLRYTKAEKTVNTFCYFLAKAVITLLILLTSVLVCGKIMDITEFPVMTSAQLSQPFSVQRIDSLFLIVFSVFGIFSIAVQSTAVVSISRNIFPNITKYRSSLTLALMIIIFLLFF